MATQDMMARYEGAKAAYELARAVWEVEPKDSSMDADYEAEMDRAQAAMRDALPIWYVLVEDGTAYAAVRTIEAARELASETDGDYGDDRTSTVWVDREIYEVRALTVKDALALPDDESERTETVTVAIAAIAPRCASRDDEHVWSDDVRFVGGLNENPGVFGHGGGVKVGRVCLRCGCQRVEDSWAQRPDTGEQGLDAVSYDDSDADSDLAYIGERLSRNADEIDGSTATIAEASTVDGAVWCVILDDRICHITSDRGAAEAWARAEHPIVDIFPGERTGRGVA